MLSSDEGENDVFFDTLDCLSVEEPVVAKEESEGGKLEYDIWMNEPRSVKERRESFLRRMDLIEYAKSSRIEDLERITECSGAVSSSSSPSVDDGEGSLACCDREMTCQTNLLGDESEQEQNIAHETEHKMPSAAKGCEPKEAQAHWHECENAEVNMKKFKKWWKHFLRMKKGGETKGASKVSKQSPKVPKTNRTMVQPNKKGYMEFTGLYMGQEIQAHKGFIWTMKFSPDGQYLASGGEDGVVRLWHVTTTDASCKPFMAEGNLGRRMDKGKSAFGRKKPIHTRVIIPDKVFQIELVQEFHGHASDVLDLAWSSSNVSQSC